MTWRCRLPPPRGCWIRGATAARRAALDILRAVGAGAPLGDARDARLEPLSERDRRLAYELSAGVLRRRAELDGLLTLTRVDPRLHDVLRLGAYQLRFLTRVPPHAAVSTSVELAREDVGEGAAKFVNQALRKLTGARSTEQGAVVGTHPRWLVERWRARFGVVDTEQLIEWNDAKPPLTIQPALWDMTRLRNALHDVGIGALEAPYAAGLTLRAAPGSGLPALRNLPGFSHGAFLVQDPAHALICRFAAIPRGALVYDACAAPGGKAVTLEALGARVVAGDGRRARVPRLVETTRRAGVAIRPLVADLEAAPFAAGRFDAVLVDAPCTATGTMRRHPDARWRLVPDIFPRAAARQGRLLAAAVPLVRRGGLLIYATCSLEPEENTAVVEEFLAEHAEFRRAPPSPGDGVPAELVTPAGDFQSLPQRHEVDGAYAARLERLL